MRTCYSAVLLVAALGAGLAGCQSSSASGRPVVSAIPMLAPESASAAGLSAQQANQAVSLYTAKCVRCHKSYDPTIYNDAQWRTWMTKMSKKARLTPEQDELLSRYLTAFRAANSQTNKTIDSKITK
jgi:cytochrome c5